MLAIYSCLLVRFSESRINLNSKNGRLYGRNEVVYMGANTHGQLCNGRTNDIGIPHQILNEEGNLKLERVNHIQGGGGFIEFLTDDGELFVCGQNHRGQLGLGHVDNVNILLQNHLCKTINGKIIKISCGWEHTLCLTDKGTVYVWGSNSRHQLGLGDVTSVSTPTQLNYPKFVTDVAAGLKHSLAVTDSGDVVSWGTGRHRQLGLDGVEIIKFPTIVSINDVKTKKVCCGANHSAALSENGNVYIWGSNSHGQLGLQPNVVKQNTIPLLISPQNFNLEPVTELHSGWSHFIAITKESNTVYGWGRNDYGQLGCHPGSSWTPTKLNLNLISVSVGSEHNLGVTNDSRLVSWGWNEHGVCGTGSESKFIVQPNLINTLKEYRVHCIGTNCGSCYAIVR